MRVIPAQAEGPIIEVLKGVQDHAAGTYAALYHLSDLQENYKSDYQLKIAVNVLNDLFHHSEGTIGLFSDGDLALIYPNADKALIEKSIFQLRYLFVDDPLAYLANGDENPDFCTVYDLGFQWRDFSDMCRAKFADEPEEEQGRKARRVSSMDIPPDLSDMAMFTAELSRTDLGPCFRRQPICVVKKEKAQAVFDEIYIHIAQLKKTIGVEADIARNKGLFHFLTHELDKRVLETLGKQAAAYLRTPVSLNINIDTIFSERFENFDKDVKASIKPSIIFEIQVSEVFSDINGFIAARNMLHNLGYRVCLDGLTRLSFTQIDREALHVDFAKLLWPADRKQALKKDEYQPTVKAIKTFGPERVILCRCDSKHAVEYGGELGISLYQGRFIDKIIDPDAKIIN